MSVQVFCHTEHEFHTRIFTHRKSSHPTTQTEASLTQLYITDPHALFSLLKDFFKVNSRKATGHTCHQHSHQSHKLRAWRQDVLLRINFIHWGPLWRLKYMQIDWQRTSNLSISALWCANNVTFIQQKQTTLTQQLNFRLCSMVPAQERLQPWGRAARATGRNPTFSPAWRQKTMLWWESSAGTWPVWSTPPIVNMTVWHQLHQTWSWANFERLLDSLHS